MIVVEKDGTLLRCTGCRLVKRLELTGQREVNAIKRGFDDYHADCKFAPSVEAARQAIKDRSRRAFLLQALHHQLNGKCELG